MERWIKLYEKIKEWQHYQEPTVLLVFIDILLSANTKDGWSLGRMIKRGELVTSVAQIMFSTGIKSDNTVRAALRKLEASGEIKRERFGNGSKITIIQFDKYQGLESPKRQEPRQPEDIEEPEELPQESENTETEAMWDAVIEPWLEYKKEKKQSYKGERSLKALKTKLKRLSGDNLEVARQIIEQSMANNYSGLFELKEQSKPNTTFSEPQQKIGYEIYGSFKNVQLKPSEYRTLEMNYSKAALDEAIENLSCKLADGTAQSNNNYATLTRWLSYAKKYGSEARQESGYKGDRSIGSEFTYKS
jgi:hypothetical protein